MLIWKAGQEIQRKKQVLKMMYCRCVCMCSCICIYSCIETFWKEVEIH